MIGGNDLKNGTAGDAVAENIKTIIGMIQERLPHGRILLLGLLPAEAPETIVEEGLYVNSVISGYADGDRVEYLWMGEAFGTPEGTPLPELYKPDLTHLVEAGYQVWATEMRELFEKLLQFK